MVWCAHPERLWGSSPGGVQPAMCSSSGWPTPSGATACPSPMAYGAGRRGAGIVFGMVPCLCVYTKSASPNRLSGFGHALIACMYADAVSWSDLYAGEPPVRQSHSMSSAYLPHSSYALVNHTPRSKSNSRTMPAMESLHMFDTMSRMARWQTSPSTADPYHAARTTWSGSALPSVSYNPRLSTTLSSMLYTKNVGNRAPRNIVGFNGVFPEPVQYVSAAY